MHLLLHCPPAPSASQQVAAVSTEYTPTAISTATPRQLVMLLFQGSSSRAMANRELMKRYLREPRHRTMIVGLSEDKKRLRSYSLGLKLFFTLHFISSILPHPVIWRLIVVIACVFFLLNSPPHPSLLFPAALYPKSHTAQRSTTFQLFKGSRDRQFR